jgi:hypothetical protein
MLRLRGVKHQKNIPATDSANSKIAHNPTMSIDFPKEEERILARWKDIDAFQRQVELVCYVFYTTIIRGTRAPKHCDAASIFSTWQF